MPGASRIGGDGPARVLPRTLSAAALSYASRGWPVFPLAPHGKTPLISKADGGSGFHDATTDPERIRAWWACEPRANVGIRTGEPSGLDVLDVDPKNGGPASLEALLREHGPLPDTLTAESGSGGTHFVFLHAPGLRRRIGFRAGLDALGDGGYAVVAPSVHPNGRAYRWIPGVRVVASWPPWLLAIARESTATRVPSTGMWSDPIPAGFATRYGRAALDRACSSVAQAPRGKRNTTINASAYSLGRLVAAGHLAVGDVERALRAAAEANGYLAEAGEPATQRVIASGLAAGIAAGPRGPTLPWATRRNAR